MWRLGWASLSRRGSACRAATVPCGTRPPHAPAPGFCPHGPRAPRVGPADGGRPCVAGGGSGLLRHAAGAAGGAPRPPRDQPLTTAASPPRRSCRIIALIVHNTHHVRTPDTLAQGALGNAAGALATATPTTRRLAAHSLSANTRAAYRCALRQFDTWRGATPATDATLAAYLGWLFEQGRAPATAALGVAAVTFRATLAGTPVRGPQTDRVLAGFRRDGADRGRGQAAPLRADGLAAILATADRPRVTGRGREAGAVAARRGALDKALAAVLFQGGLRRADAAALEWRDVAPATTAGAILVTVRRSKTDQEGTAADVRYLKSGAAVAVLALRPADAAPTARVFGGRTPQQLGRRFTAAAAAAGLPGRLTAHSGRVGLASELTARGASTTAVMLAGAWKTARMVAHYSAGATAELGAVARYL